MRRAGKVAVGMLAGAMALAGAGCDPGSAEDTNPDGGVSTSDGGASGLDAPAHTSGLLVLWACDPTPVAELGDDLELSAVHLRLRDVRAIGDAAPGDRRTSVDALELHWQDGEEPDGLDFPEAPLGLYSRFEFKVEGEGGWDGPGGWGGGGGGSDGGAVVLQGEVQLPGDEGRRRFTIDGHGAFSESLAVDLELEVGRGGTLIVTFDAAAVLAVVDWEAVELNEDGELELDEQSPQMDAVRAALADAFFVETLP